jgi:hypothetical protein
MLRYEYFRYSKYSSAIPAFLFPIFGFLLPPFFTSIRAIRFLTGPEKPTTEYCEPVIALGTQAPTRDSLTLGIGVG